ncbi:MAG: dethiobiotin synthase [Bacteroidia bacterium]
MRKIFVTGIGTDVGKTVVSTILVESLKADYWKPIQSGTNISTDTNTVKELISNSKSKFYPEAYSLKEPISPHAAAALENIEIKLNNISLPKTDNTLIIEGAGGIMVPLTDNFFMLDLIKKFDAEVVLVIQNYLGSINHSLLSIEVLKYHQLKILGIVFNGDSQPSSERIILEYSKLKLLGRIPKESIIDKEMILKYATNFELLNTY